jgi:DNA-binding transcriptional regulator YdaS (Cro superfamily)
VTIGATRGNQAVLAALRRLCKAAGDQRAFARQAGLSPSLIADVLRGRKTISGRLARICGYERVTVYRKLPREPKA